MKLYLHIGIEKTGTSSIQSALYRNRKMLLEQKSILYPTTGLWNDFSHHGLSFSFMQSDLHGKTEDKIQLISNLKQEISKSECDSVFLSSEIFRGFDASQIEEFFLYFDNLFDEFELIVFLRDQPYWLMSMYNQLVKDQNVRYKKDFKSFCQDFSEKADFHQMLGSWTDIFNFNKVHVFQYFEKNHQDRVSSIRHIENLLDISLSMDLDQNKNPSLNRTQLEFIRHFNRFDIRTEERGMLNNNIIQSFSETNDDYMYGKYAICNIEMKEELHNRYLDSNKKISKKYLFEDKELFPTIFESIDSIEMNALNIQNFSKLVIYTIKKSINLEKE